jgi:antitoxin (DNA-binding transcriptional repressor) of toxin-antitoxin stability system
MHEAKTRLTELVAAVEKGERVVITRHGKPAAELVAPQTRKSGIDWNAIRAAKARLGIDRFFDASPEETEAALAPMDADELFGPEWAHKFDYRETKKPEKP